MKAIKIIKKMKVENLKNLKKRIINKEILSLKAVIIIIKKTELNVQ